MSEIKVNSILGVGARAAAITVNNSDGTWTANLSTRQNRNLIINGAMQVPQRGTSSTSTGYQTVDRFSPYHGGTDEAPTYAQVDVASGTTPYSLGFRKAFKITNGNQTSGAGGSDEMTVKTVLEAQDIASSGWNYTSASSFITLSFWIKSSVAQNFYGFLLTSDGSTRSFAFETGSLSADTWTKITKTIPGNSNLTFNNDNGVGLEILIVAFMGTNLTGSAGTVDSWVSFTSTQRTPDNTSTWYTTNDATLEITGVQLEVGSVATDFEHRSFAQELALCQRYFFSETGDNADYPGCYTGGMARSGHFFWMCHFPVAMRTNPTYTGVSGNGQAYGDGDSSTFANSAAIVQGTTTTPNPRGMGMRATSPGGSMSNGKGYMYRFSGDTNVLQFSAEL